MTQPLLFMHIPRTAGTTLNSILTRLYPGPAAMKLPNYADAGTVVRLLDEHQKKNAGRSPSVYRGHVNFGIHQTIPGRYFSIVRDPLERIISHYWFARCKNSDTVKKTDGEFMSLEEFVDPDRLGVDVTNLQSRMFAGTYRLFRTDSSQSALDGFESSDALYRAAVGNLDRFDAVGVTERFDESMLLLQRTFDWDMPVYVPHNAVVDRPRLLSHALAERIRTLNDVDMALYDEVCCRFDATWKSQTSYFQSVQIQFVRAQSEYLRDHSSQRLRSIKKGGEEPKLDLAPMGAALPDRETRRAA